MTAKETLRKQLHGLSDDQFEKVIPYFPYNECLIAMEKYAAQVKTEPLTDGEIIVYLMNTGQYVIEEDTDMDYELIKEFQDYLLTRKQ